MVQVKIFESTSNKFLVIAASSTITIGRGFLECNDIRISKNHGELTVVGNELKIKAIHKNPIFYKHVNEQYKILKTNCEIFLKNSDKFSLLPMPNVEFEVKIQSDGENGQSNTESGGFRIRNVGEINENLESGSISTTMSQIFSRNENLPDTTERDEDPERTPSPENLRPPQSHEVSSDNVSNSNLTQKRPFQEDQSGERSEEPSPSKKSRTEESEAAISQTDPPTDEVVKNIKSDPDSTTTNQQPTTSTSTEPACSSSSVTVKPDPDAPTLKSETNLRPSCEFGIRCFRFAPDHRRDFAHPQDSDYRRPNFPNPPDSTPPCPWGPSCYRRNPAHFQALSHPPSSVYTTSTTTTISSAVTTATPILQQSNVQQNPRYNQIRNEDGYNDGDDDSERDLNDSRSDRGDGESIFDDSDADADFMGEEEYNDEDEDEHMDDEEDDETEDNNLEE